MNTSLHYTSYGMDISPNKVAAITAAGGDGGDAAATPTTIGTTGSCQSSSTSARSYMDTADDTTTCTDSSRRQMHKQQQQLQYDNHMHSNLYADATSGCTTPSSSAADVAERRQNLNIQLESFGSDGTSATSHNSTNVNILLNDLDINTVPCFPLDLDLVTAYQQYLISKTSTKDVVVVPDNDRSTTDQYTIQELQSISCEARSHLMELTVSREGRELQRWEHLGSSSASMIVANQNCIQNDQQLNTQHIDTTAVVTTTLLNAYPNCRLTTGCVPILPGGRIVLISSSKSSNIFVLPKGGWEQNESLPLAALRETLEEAGVTGILGVPLPPLTYETKKSVSRRLLLSMGSEELSSTTTTTNNINVEKSMKPSIVTSESPVSAYHTHNRLVMFPMYVQCIYNHWPEENRLRRVVTIEEAIQLLQHRPEFLHMLQTVQEQNLHLIGGDPININQ